MAKLKITQTGSPIGRKPGQRDTLKALGLAARVLQAAGRGDSPEARRLVARARLLVQDRIGQRVTEAVAKPFAEADHRLLSGDPAGAVARLTAAYRAAG